MDNSLKISLQVSVAFHILILAGIPIRQRQIVSIPLNIELLKIKPAVSEKPVEKPKEDGVKLKKKDTKKEALPKKKEDTQKPKQENTEQIKPQLLKASSNMMLEAKEFPFAYYLKVLQNKIASNWIWPDKGGVLKATVYFRILKDGTISDINVDKTSGDYLYDQSAKRAVTLTNPMTPLPEGYSENNLGVYFEFSFSE